MIKFDRIETLMKLNNLTQTELLQKARQSPNNFARWKAGKSNPSWSSVTAIANVLGVDPRYLLGQTDSPYGGEIVEKAMEYMTEAGADVIPAEDENGPYFILRYDDHTNTYTQIDFQNLCRKLLTEINDTTQKTSIKFCDEHFGSKKSINTKPEYSKEERDLIDRYRKLSSDGRIKIIAALIDEERLNR